MNFKKTLNLLIDFSIKRLAEISGLLILISGCLIFVALLTYSPEDPNFIFPENTEIDNLLGFRGSYIADLLLQSFGFVAYLICCTLIITGINIFRYKEFFLIIENIFFTILYSVFGTFFLSYYYLILSKIFLLGIHFH